MRRLATIGVASGLGASIAGSEHGPSVLMRSGSFQHLLQSHGIEAQWSLIHPETEGDRFQILKRLFHHTAQQMHKVVSSGEPFVAIGGDHSMAMGIWRGVMSALKPKRLGLLWIDAHLDLHTMDTSVSCNVHGMPLSALLGQGDDLLQDIYGTEHFIDPANVALIGGHSYEQDEIALARRMALATFDMPAIRHSGSLVSVMEQALRLVADSSDRFGVSIDLDVLDPRDAPGVNTPEKGGIRWQELQRALSLVCADCRLVGVEIAEFNPMLDRGGKTQQIIAGLIGTIYGDLGIVSSPGIIQAREAI